MAIIGGMFASELREPGVARGEVAMPAFFVQPHLLLATARSAFAVLNSFLQPSIIWLPSYLCDVILHALSGVHLRFYAVDDRLRISEEGWISDVQAGDMVVFIDYFGFNQWRKQGEEVRKRGAWVVEDACHAMLNETFCEHAQYVILSPRKFFGLPDGGIVLSQGDARLPGPDLPPPPSLWWLISATASQLRAEFDRYGGENRWFELFQRSESEAPSGPFRMSQLSEVLLRHVIDPQDAARRRRENFVMLASELPELSLYDKLPDNVVPLGFPVRLKKRDMVRKALFDRQIYPPVHWAIKGVVPSDFIASHRLADEIMTLPCDQRYGESDMMRLAKEVRRAASG